MRSHGAVFIDAVVVKIRDGQVANRPIYAAIGVSLDGERDILGLWAGSGAEGAKFTLLAALQKTIDGSACALGPSPNVVRPIRPVN